MFKKFESFIGVLFIGVIFKQACRLSTYIKNLNFILFMTYCIKITFYICYQVAFVKKVILSVFLCILPGLCNVCTAIPIAGEEADVFSRDPDSLRYLLSIETDDTSKVKLYCNLMAVYIDEKLDSAFLFLEPALKLAESIQWKEGIASVKTEGGRLYWRKGKFEQALSYHYDALVHYIKKGDQANIGALITYIGQDYADWGKYPEALVYFNKADSIF